MPRGQKIDYSSYIGQTFSSLTILSLYRRERDNLQIFRCQCSCGAFKDVSCNNLLSGLTFSCGCAKRETSQINYRKTGRKTGKENIKKANALGLGDRPSKRESALRSWCQETFGPDNVSPKSVLIGNHRYDILVNNTWLIEYHGIFYHSSDYHNENNPDAKGPRAFKPIDFHYNILQNALNHGYRLIQVWEDQIDDFIHKLIKSQVDGTARIEDYILSDGLLCNDYGFPLSSTIIPDTGTWYSDSKEKVDESYPKGRLLVYNSGYSKY